MHGEENVARGNDCAQQRTKKPSSDSVNRHVLLVGWRDLEK